MKRKVIFGLTLALSGIPLANAPTIPVDRKENIDYNFKKKVEETEVTGLENILKNYGIGRNKELTRLLDLETYPFGSLAEQIKEELTLKIAVGKTRGFVDEFYKTGDNGYSKERIFALIYSESEGNKKARSRVDARGLTQVMKQTWEWMEPNKDFEKYAYEPITNIKVGIKTLKWFQDYCEKNCPYWEEINEDEKIKVVSACYNGGQRTVEEANWDISKTPNETRLYSSRLLWAYHRLKDKK